MISNTDNTNIIKNKTTVEPYENARRLSILRRQRKVLIVDDESTGRTILTKNVQQIEDGISVDALDNPIEALSCLHSNKTDLIT